MLVFRILLLIATTTATDFLQPIQPGVYKETLGPVQLIANNAEVWTKIDLGGIESEMFELKTLSEKTDERCRRSVLPDTACDNFKNLSSTIEANLNEKHERMTQERSRRGLLNVFGSMAKFLFGTMDADDSEKLDEKMKLLFDEKWATKNFKIKYTEIVEKTVSRLNLTTDVVNHNSHALETIEKQLAVLSEQQGANREAFIIMGLKNSYIALSQALSNKIDGIHQMLIDLHNGVLNTHYVSYSELIKAFKKIKIDDSGITWPFDLEKKDFEILRKLLKFSVFSSDSMLLIVFSLPLVEVQDFNLQKFYAVPFIKDNMATFVNIDQNLIVADNKFEKFTSLTESEKSARCLKTKNKWFCSKLNLMQTDKASCLGTLVEENSANLDVFCKLKVLALNKTLLVKTENANRFLVFSGNPKTVKVILKDSKAKLDLNGTQVLTVTEAAVIKIDNFEVKFFPATLKTNLEITIPLSWPSQLTDVNWDTPELKLAEPSKQVLLSQDFADLGQDLAGLKNFINENNFKAYEEKRNRVVGILTIVVFGILILAAGMYVFKYKSLATLLCSRKKIEETDKNKEPQQEEEAASDEENPSLERGARGRDTA